jgi:hypothetical protein
MKPSLNLRRPTVNKSLKILRFATLALTIATALGIGYARAGTSSGGGLLLDICPPYFCR